jgi:uncharacterized membrane protein (TIGR02234 family)
VTSRRVAVLAVLLGCGVGLLAQGRTWASARIGNGVSTADAIAVSGAGVAPGLTALALVAGAGGVVLATAGRRVVQAAAVLVAASGAGILVLATQVARDPGGALHGPAVEASGLTTVTVSLVSVTAWIAVGMLAGALIGAGAVLALLRGSAWAGPSRRYERVEATVAATDEPLWDAISRGEDPTG